MATIRVWCRVVRADLPKEFSMKPLLERIESFIRSYGDGIQHCPQITAGPQADNWEIFLDADDLHFHHLIRVSSEVRAILNEKPNLAASREFMGQGMRQLNYLLREIDDIKVSIEIVAHNLDKTKYIPVLRCTEIKEAKLGLKRLAR